MTFVLAETWLETPKKITNGSNKQFLLFLIQIL